MASQLSAAKVKLKAYAPQDQLVLSFKLQLSTEALSGAVTQGLMLLAHCRLNPYAVDAYDGINLNPLEVVFVKVKSFLLQAKWTAPVISQTYDRWASHEVRCRKGLTAISPSVLLRWFPVYARALVTCVSTEADCMLLSVGKLPWQLYCMSL